MRENKPLTSLHVLVTRPNTLAEDLCADIKHLGGEVTHFPVIEITDPVNTASLQHAIDAVDGYDIALFISPTAARQTSKHIKLSALILKIGAIGEATASALEKEQCFVDIKPEGHNSESLLKHPQLQSEFISDKRIIIFKGEGGLKLLSDTLTSRGADVFNSCVYARIKPDDYTPLTKATLKNIDVILVSSGEGLENLTNMTEDKSCLTDLNIIVPGSRCATIAKELGFKSVITSDNATNRSFIHTLINMK